MLSVLERIGEAVKHDLKLAFEFMSAGVVYTILVAEQRTFFRFIQACIVALFVGFTSFPVILAAIRHAAITPVEMNMELAGSFAAVSAFLAHYILTGLIVLGKYFAIDPLRFWRRIKEERNKE